MTTSGAMEKSGCVRAIEGEEVRDDPVKYFLPAGVGSTFGVPEGMMAIEVPQNEKISGGGKNRGRKGVGYGNCWRGANSGVYILRNDREEELLRKMLTPT